MRSLLNILYITLLISFSVVALAQTPAIETSLTKVYAMFENGEYKETIEKLNEIESEKKLLQKDEKLKALIPYWKGLAYSRMNEYPKAITYFEKAISLRYKAKDLFYEYGQALYVSEKLSKARLAFRKSVKLKYKMAVSLYYIAFISQQLKDFKKAVSFYNTIEKLPDEEKEEVIQASRMQIADIYYAQVRKRPNSYESIKKYVIPQYEKALNWNETTSLAVEIKAKIENIKRKFDMELFQMRNGRNTARPPYFLKVNTLYGTNDNVNNLDQDSIDSSSEDVGSGYYTLGFFGRYTFYPSNTYSIAPEIRAIKTKYMTDVSDIYANDNSKVNFNLKINYEKTFNDAPATTYFDIIYAMAENDEDADEKLQSSFIEKGISVSEERQFFKGSPSIFRLKYSQFDYVEELSDNSNNVSSFIWEQVINLSSFTIYLYNAYDMTKFNEDETLDTNSLTMRSDFIFPTFYGLFNPILYASLNNTKYINNDSRDSTSLQTLGISINRPLSRKWYLTLDFSNSQQNGELDSDIYKQQNFSLNLDFVY
jgi:tetratricopeptide (TPR) repeat protein